MQYKMILIDCLSILVFSFILLRKEHNPKISKIKWICLCFSIIFITINRYLQISFKREAINSIILILGSCYIFYTIKKAYNKKRISHKILYITLSIFLLFLTFKPLFYHSFLNLFEVINRDIYYFPTNSKENFTVISVFNANHAVTTMEYRKELFPGIICKKEITTWNEQIDIKNNKDNSNFLKSQKIDIDYDEFYKMIKESKDKSFCYKKLNTNNIKIQDIIYTSSETKKNKEGNNLKNE